MGENFQGNRRELLGNGIELVGNGREHLEKQNRTFMEMEENFQGQMREISGKWKRTFREM